jgi:hypothetical protein
MKFFKNLYHHLPFYYLPEIIRPKQISPRTAWFLFFFPASGIFQSVIFWDFFYPTLSQEFSIIQNWK